MDEAVSMKLEMKNDTQKSLRAAVGAYRKIGNNYEQMV